MSDDESKEKKSKETNNNKNDLLKETMVEIKEKGEDFSIYDRYDADAAVLDELSIKKTTTLINLNKRKQSFPNEA